MKIVTGNLVDLAEQGTFDVIVHGCNCFCNMGKGIALEIKDRYPEAYKADCITIKGDENKLGRYTQTKVQFMDNSFIIINAYTQYRFGWGGPHADYEAIEKVFGSIADNFYGKRIAYPKIGAGLAGGDWEIISSIIDEELEGMDHTVVIL